MSRYSLLTMDSANHARFALKELRLILATLVRRYELERIPGQSEELRVWVVPAFKDGKYMVGVKQRA